MIFSSWPRSDDVIEIVKSRLIKVNDIGGQLPNDRAWTKQIFERISETIENQSQNTAGEWHWCGYAGGAYCERNRITGEWLYDLTWLIYEDIGKASDRNERAIRMPLALECEWKKSPEELHADFLKLVTSRAEVIVFIHQGKHEQEILLTKQAEMFVPRGSSQRVLFARWEKDEFHFREWSPVHGFLHEEER